MGLARGSVAVGVSERMSALASLRLHVLVVECPGAFAVRAAVERATLGRGWRLAGSSAEADALVVCGTATAPVMLEAVEAVWEQLSGPRSRADISDVAGVADCLEKLVADWRDPTRRRDDAHRRVKLVVSDSELTDHSQTRHGEMVHGQMDDGGRDQGMMTSGPGGIALASGAPDRDGLEMDVLHLRLGPVLADWPAGLVVWFALQGDAVTEVEVEVVEVPGTAEGGTSWLAYRVDAAARVLSLAGAAGLSAEARRLRGRLLDHDTSEQVLRELAILHRKVSRARLLRWSLRGLGEVHDDAEITPGSPRWRGDVHQRLLGLLDVERGAATESEALTHSLARADLQAVAAALTYVLPGNDLAAARLVVASLVGQAGMLAATPNHDSHRAGA